MSVAAPYEEPTSGPGASTPRQDRAVFVGDFVHVDRPFDEAARLLLDSRGEWFHRLQVTATQQGLQLTVDEPRPSGATVIVPVSWEPCSPDSRLPELDGDIELVGTGDGHCRLAMNGRYRVARALAGSAERLDMHRGAELALRRLSGAVAEALTAS
ncbi:MAG: hypothetical protein ACLPQS_16690 [Acidimicrobiales bacterium]